MVAASDDNKDNKLSFSDLSVETIREKLSTALSDELGPHAAGYRVEEVSLDHRARIVSTVDKAVFVAEFMVRPGGTVFFAEPSSQWERLAPAPPEADTQKPPVSAPANKVTLSDIKTEGSTEFAGRLRAALEKRRQLLSS
jgi:hypothetical protein